MNFQGLGRQLSYSIQYRFHIRIIRKSIINTLAVWARAPTPTTLAGGATWGSLQYLYIYHLALSYTCAILTMRDEETCSSLHRSIMLLMYSLEPAEE